MENVNIENRRGLLEDGQKRKIMRLNLRVLCYQEMSKIINIEFLMSSRTKSCETSTEKLRMVHAVLLEILKPYNIQARLPFYHLLL